MNILTAHVNTVALAAADWLDVSGTASARAAIPGTNPQQYVVAGTLEAIAEIVKSDFAGATTQALSGIDLDKLEALARAATPGPWLHRIDPGNKGMQHCLKLAGEHGAWVADCLDNADRSTNGGIAGERNARFIAAANPQTILALIAQARAAQPTADFDKLRGDIMNLPCERTMSHFADRQAMLHYKEGHRDARHAAFDLVGAFAAQCEDAAQAAVPVGQQAPATSEDVALRTLNEVCDLFHIGTLARTHETILANVQNTLRRSECLSAVEREFFTTEVLPDEDDDPDGEPGEECMLNWGDSPEQYVDRFREALTVISAPAAPAAPQPAAQPVQGGEAVDERALFMRAINATYPIPNSPHNSVIQRAMDNREAFSNGWDAARATLTPVAAQQAAADPNWRDEALKAAWPYIKDIESVARLFDAAAKAPAAQAVDVREGELLPCPFCGSSNISAGEQSTTDVAGETVVQSVCMDCGGCGPGAALDAGEIDYGDVKSSAAWNRRAATPASTPETSQQGDATSSEDARDAARYRWLRTQRGIAGDFPADGDVWVVQLHQPRGTIPDLRCAGFGDKLDAAIDAAMRATQQEGE